MNLTTTSDSFTVYGPTTISTITITDLDNVTTTLDMSLAKSYGPSDILEGTNLLVDTVGIWGTFYSAFISDDLDEDIVTLVSSTSFTKEGNGQYFGYKGRDNLTVLKFKVDEEYEDQLNLNNGFFDFEGNNVDKVVIEFNDTSFQISSDTEALTLSRENLIIRFGDFNIPYDYTGKINIILYVGNDPDGIMITGHSSKEVMTLNYKT